MAGKININPDAIKRNLDLIIVVLATLALLAYGWLQLGVTEETRAKSAGDLVTNTETYNEKKNFLLPEGLGLTNAPTITTDKSHGNLALVKKAETNFVTHLDRVRSKFSPLEIPDGVELDEKTGAITSVSLMQGGTKYLDTPPSVRVVSVKGKGAKLVASTRSLGGDTPGQFYVEKIDVIDGGTGYTKGDIAIIIGDESGGGGMDPSGIEPPPSADPAFNAPPGQVGMPGMGMMGMGMMGMGMMGSGGASTDDSEARYGLDNNTFRNFMQSTIFGLQNQCKAQRIRLPKIDDENKEFRFSFSKVWDTFEFEPLEREVMSFQLAEIEALCRALFTANIHEIYNLKRLKVVRSADEMGGDMEDALEYLPDAKFSLNDVMKFATGSNPDGSQRQGLVPGARVMPYEVTFRGFSTELSKVLEELYKSNVFFVVKNIAVIEATGVVDVFEEDEDEMSLGAMGGGARSSREMYGMGARGMMDPRYQAMLGGSGYGAGGEKKRRRPASLLLDESPLKVTLRINSLKVVAKEKDQSDAISALAQKIETAKEVDEEEDDNDEFATDGDEDEGVEE